ATLRFESGALGSIVATTAAAPGFPHRVEVYGTQGGVQLEGEGVARFGGSNPRPEVTPTGAAEAGGGGGARGGSAGGQMRAGGELVAASRSGGARLVPGGGGRRSLELVLAIYEAAARGGTRAVRAAAGAAGC